jgi:hypothetical protein
MIKSGKNKVSAKRRLVPPDILIGGSHGDDIRGFYSALRMNCSFATHIKGRKNPAGSTPKKSKPAYCQRFRIKNVPNLPCLCRLLVRGSNSGNRFKVARREIQEKYL